MDAWGIDLVVSGSQKGLMLPPGLGFCALSEKAWRRTKTSTLPKFYFSLADELKYVAKNEVRFTPAVSIMVGLRERCGWSRPKDWPTCSSATIASRARRAPGRGPRARAVREGDAKPGGDGRRPSKGIDSEKIVAAYSQGQNITIAGGQGR